jgi:hypothetical protein
MVEIKTEDPKRKYHEVIDLPSEVDIENVNLHLLMDCLK